MNTRILRSALLVAMVLGIVVAIPAGASGFSIANFNYVNSDLQASGHPGVSISFERRGTESEDLKDLQLDLPAGVFANPEAANPKCTAAQFNSDTCPANSLVGDVTAVVKAAGLLDLTIHGVVNVLTPADDQTATMGLTLRPDKICILFVFCAVPQKIFLKTGVTLRTYGDQGLRTSTPGATNSANVGIPLVFFTPSLSLDITINKLQLNFNSRSGPSSTRRVCGGFLNLSCKNVITPPSGPLFWRQTGSCTPTTAALTATSHQGVQASASSTFTPTGCSAVPFDPSITVDTQSRVGGEPTPLTFSLNIPEDDLPIQHALPKLVDVDLPTGSGLNLEALSGVEGCTEAQLAAASCPEASIIGSANAFSKYLPGPTASAAGLSGNVYAMGVGTQVPIAVELKGRGGTVVLFRGTMGSRGDPQLGDGRVYSTFDRVPELPFGQLNLTIEKPVYKNPSTCGAATTNAEITGFNGAPPTGFGTVVQRSSIYEVVDCDIEPDTTITDGPPLVSSIVRPTFQFETTVPGSAFQCRIDDEAFAPCASPHQVEPLTAGTHSFEVKAINGATEDPSPAEYGFDVSTSGFTVTPSITVSDSQARSHPDLTASFAVDGGQPRSVSLRLPEGFAASLSARPLCALEDAEAGTCDASSRIGVGTITVDLFGGGSETAVGEGFLAEAPTTSDAAGIALKADFTFGQAIVIGGAYLVNNGRHQYLTLREIPQVIGTTQVNTRNITAELDGSNNDFLTAPSNCNESSWLSTGVDYAENDAEIFNIPFQATGCENVGFNPSVTQTLTSTVSGTETGVYATVTMGSGDAGIDTMRVNEPPSLAPNFPAFGSPQDQCPESATPDPDSTFDPLICPEQAKVGSMEIHTPLLPYVLDGDVYLIEKSPIPWLGVSFDRPGISVRLTGVTSTPKVNPACNPVFTPGGCQTQISVIFNDVPDVPVTKIDFVLDGEMRQGVSSPLSGKMLRVASPTDPACDATTPARSFFDSHAQGPTVQRDQDITITGCV